MNPFIFIKKIRYSIAIRRVHSLRLQFFNLTNTIRESLTTHGAQGVKLSEIEKLCKYSDTIIVALIEAEKYDTYVYIDESGFDGNIFYHSLKGDFKSVLSDLYAKLLYHKYLIDASLKDLEDDTSTSTYVPMDTVRGLHLKRSIEIRSNIIQSLEEIANMIGKI